MNDAKKNSATFSDDYASTGSFKIKKQTGNNGRKDVEIMVPLKYLNNFWGTLEIPLINCETNLSTVRAKIKGGTYIINLDEYKSIGTPWIALYTNNNNITYFDSFRVEYTEKETEELIGNKNIITDIYRVQEYDLIMWRHDNVLDLLV